MNSNLAASTLGASEGLAGPSPNLGTTPLADASVLGQSGLAQSGLGRGLVRIRTLGQTVFGQGPTPVKVALQLAGLLSSMAGFYHGYRRNQNSIGWGLGWFFLSGLFWPIMMPLAYAQGFAQPKAVGLGKPSRPRRRWRKR